jgi:small basic protein
VIPLLSLLAGALLAILLRPSVPETLTPYVAIGVVVAIDSAFGGFRSYLERTFNDRVFVLAFVSNAALGIFLVWVGDQLGVSDFGTAVVIVFGVRIFQNLAAIRRRVFGG